MDSTDIRRTPTNVCESESAQASSFGSIKYLKGLLLSFSGIQTNSNLLGFNVPCLSKRRFVKAERTYEVNSSFSFVATYVSQSVSRCLGQIRTMKNSICSSQQQNSSSKPSQVEDPLYSTIMANIVFNVCLCYPTITLNILTIHALRKTSARSSL